MFDVLELYLYSGNKLRGGVAHRIHVFLFRDKRLHPPLQKLKTLSKIWGSTSWLASKHWTNFPSSLLGWELRKCTVWERAIFFTGSVLREFQKKKICTYWLSVRARRKIFGSKSWRTDRAKRRAKYDRVLNIFLSSSYKLGP